MKPEPPREEALFQAASQLTGPSRAAFLDQACTNDGAMRQRLEALLAAHDQPDELLDAAGKPPVQPTMKIQFADDAPDEAVGQTLGRYKLLERVGEGGCGVVYVAEQTEPVRRRVALKVIKLGMDTKQVVARFEAERQALAMMDHPNIAKVLDAGTTDVGRPFFVMELVRGIRITDYCDQANLTTKERLDLFIKVCQAIQHAHQKGIIHRDIKPSNILVTLHDGVPVPKVIDFGIAKATEGRLTDNTVYTQLHQFIGTPAYMSPEQAEMSGLDIDTRSDIYSLGVLLYELLAGSTPFDAKELMASGIDVMRKTIREKEPVRPSTKLATLKGDELTTTAKRRSVETSKLANLLRGDLDWIVMRALEKDRTRRYDTANGLAMDITRYLTNEPIVARPPSTAYRVQKFVRRNRLAVTAGVVVAVALMVGVVLSTLGFVQAKVQRDRAVRSEREAKTSAAEATSSAGVARTKQAQAEASDLAARQSALSARQNAYAADMNLAETAFRAGNLSRTRELLEGTRPRPGEVDLRDWEWRYLWRGCRSDALFTFAQQIESVTSLSFSPDGEQLAVGEWDGTVRFWNVAARKEIKVIEARGQTGVGAFSPQGDRFACAAEANAVTLWNTKTWIAQAQLPTGRLKTLAFSGDGDRLATWSEATKTTLQAQIWDVASTNLIQTFPAGNSAEFQGSMAFSSDGGTLVVGEVGGRLQVWDTGTGKLQTSIPAHDGGYAMKLAISPDGQTLASSAQYTNTTIKLWELKTGRPLASLTNHQRHITALRFSPDGKWLVSGSEDQTIRFWDMERKEQTHVLRGQWSAVWSLAFLPDGRTLASSGSDGSVCFWNLGFKPREKTFVTMELSPKPAISREQIASFTPDSQSILALDRDGAVVRWDCANGQPSETLSAFGTNNHTFLFSPSGRLLVVADSVGNLKVWDWVGNRLLTNIAAHAAPVFPFAFKADESQFISFGLNGTRGFSDYTLWDLPAWRPVFSRSNPRGGDYNRPAWSPDGRTFVQALEDGTLQFSDFPTLQTQASFKAHQARSPMDVSFSPDGKLLASRSADGTIKLWDAVTRTNLATMRGLSTPHSIRFAPNGRRIVTGHSSSQQTLNVVYLWDIATHRNVLALPGQGRGFYFVQFSPDGHALMAINDAGLLHLWRAPSWAEIGAAEKQEKPFTPTN